MKSLNALDKMLVLTKLKSKTKIQLTLQIPLEIYNDISLFIETCKLNGTTINGMLSLIFINGYQLYKDFLKEDIDSLMEMNFIVSYFQKMYKELVQYSNETWVMNKPSILLAEELCRKSQFGKLPEFINYIDNHRMSVVGDKILLTEVHILKLFKSYMESSNGE